MKPHPLQIERELRGWSQAKIAEELGTTTRTVRRWEQGQAIPYPYYREQLCQLFGKNARELGFIQEPDTAEVLAPESVPISVVEESFVARDAQQSTSDIEQTHTIPPAIPPINGDEDPTGWSVLLRRRLHRLSRRQLIVLALIAGGTTTLASAALLSNLEMLIFPQSAPSIKKFPFGSFTVMPIPTSEGGWIYEAYYTASNKHIYELEQTNAEWFNIDVTAQALTPQVISLDSPVSGVALHNSPRVYYFGENHHIYELSRNRKKSSYWFNNDINILSGGAPPTAPHSAITSLTVQDVVTQNIEPHIYYCGQDQHIYELTWSGVEEWLYTDLTLTAVHAQLAVSKGALVSLYIQKDQSIRVYYTGEDNHVCELTKKNGQWQYLDIMSVARLAPVVSVSSALTCFAAVDSAPRIYYAGEDQHIHELAWSDASGWQYQDVTIKAAHAPNIIPSSAFVGFLAFDASSAYVYYYGHNKHIYELTLAGESWSHLDITIAAGNAPLTASTAMLAGFSAQNDLLQMYYLAEDHHIYELLGGQRRGWQYQDITAAAM